MVLNSYDVIKEALVKYGNQFSDRPNTFVFTELTQGYGNYCLYHTFIIHLCNFIYTGVYRVMSLYIGAKFIIEKRVMGYCKYNTVVRNN